ncbi:MAG: lipoyl domain-containing protein [Candidatus Omnitrophota bacterium]|jgi:pyruvate/2-oxoglutarate dehydrogenase complex dihydrolipoamide acyltransferase (E2) component
MLIEVKVPYLGAGIEKARVTFIYCRPGEAIAKDADLIEITADKAAFNIPSPCNGKITESKVSCGDTLNVGETVCFIEQSF